MTQANFNPLRIERCNRERLHRFVACNNFIGVCNIAK